MNSILRSASVLALLAAALAASAQNLVRDPGFESAVQGFYSSGQTIDGGSWIVGAPPSGDFYFLQVDGLPSFVISGTTSVFFSGSSVAQTLATSTGGSYLVSFDAYSYSSATDPLTVGFGTSTYSIPAPIGIGSNPATAYHFSFLATASSSSTVLRFGTPSTNQFELDNVSVTAVNPTPEPSALAALGVGSLVVLRRRK